MQINILGDLLDELEPDALYIINGLPTDADSFEELCVCSKKPEGASRVFESLESYNQSKSVTWEDVISEYPKFEEKYAMKLLREERDKKLAESDVEVLPDRTPSEEILAYRQSLRDLPSVASPTLDDEGNLVVDWPVKP